MPVESVNLLAWGHCFFNLLETSPWEINSDLLEHYIACLILLCARYAVGVQQMFNEL